MLQAIEETYRRRELQAAFNEAHGIIPQGIQKAISDITERVRQVAETRAPYQLNTGDLPKDDIARIVRDLEKQMKQASKSLEFEKAAAFRDQMVELRRVME